MRTVIMMARVLIIVMLYDNVTRRMNATSIIAPHSPQGNSINFGICGIIAIMKRGFTLVELLVTISMIAMLSTIVIATIAPAQAKARDSKRLQQVRQIDVATQMYMSEHNGNAPDLGGCSALQTGNPSYSQASACFAVSIATADPQKSAWASFASQIAPYMPNVPKELCSSCTSASSYPLGYNYVAPLALQYNCAVANGGVCPTSASSINQTYQVYAGLESQSNFSAFSNNGITNSPVAVLNQSPPSIDLIQAGINSHNGIWDTVYGKFASVLSSAPSIGDFTITMSINSGPVVTVPGLSYLYAQNMGGYSYYWLSFTPVSPTTIDQTVVMRLKYQNGATFTAPSFLVPHI